MKKKSIFYEAINVNAIRYKFVDDKISIEPPDDNKVDRI